MRILLGCGSYFSAVNWGFTNLNLVGALMEHFLQGIGKSTRKRKVYLLLSSHFWNNKLDNVSWIDPVCISIWNLLLLCASVVSFLQLTYYSTMYTSTRFQFHQWDNLWRKWKNFLPRSGVGFITGTFFSSVQYTLNWDSLEHKESYHTSPIIQAAVGLAVVVWFKKKWCCRPLWLAFIAKNGMEKASKSTVHNDLKIEK